MILQQEKERLQKLHEDEEDELMTKNNVHKNVKGQKINVNDKDFQDNMMRKHAKYFNLKKLNASQSQQQPAESTYKPKINKNTTKILN